ncbi:MAG: hypothetical protein LBE81_10280 [Azonexus sp.]|jgi:hypothetical protein|uniref:hypothetical protein n=1 Tax=Azonexus sp. TaxID=1872668 RepID=UPI002830DAA1|nr:hypothetical protein [Azonexus sp.]MDR0777005.1 hypothetical protein [Azonexus sp.]
MNKSHQIKEHIGICALCNQENIVLKESHSIPKFVYQWVKGTSATPYLRSSDNVNVREQDGPKEYLLCGACEGNLSVMETELAEGVFKKIANYRSQSQEIVVTEAMRVGVLSIFWRTLLTLLNRHNSRTEEDNVVMGNFLASAKQQIKQGVVTTPIYIAPFHGEPPFYGLPVSMTYLLDRQVGGPDIRFFDDPYRYYAVFKLPFMFFYVPSEGWAEEIDPNGKFSGTVKLSQIQRIPTFLQYYILWLAENFEISKQSMGHESLERIMRDTSTSAHLTGAHKSMARSQIDKP